MRAQDVLNQQPDWGGQNAITDADIVARCDRCGANYALSKCSFVEVEQVEQVHQEGVYQCPSCSDTLLTVVPFVEGTEVRAGRGYRVGAWIFRNSAELFVRGLKIPVSWKPTL